ncbi:hypothetical protein TGRUB_428740 [Toxoplasma gondii RUB]|uniref:Transmembrane protein n=1 Tax=Toxoplasma gondii RUB TaxID=935652 RepID=A0A086MAP0_TOXGO|nr:hypothetical protein TGRUB_428740 [Toxoplasma gondii RUB]
MYTRCLPVLVLQVSLPPVVPSPDCFHCALLTCRSIRCFRSSPCTLGFSLSYILSLNRFSALFFSPSFLLASSLAILSLPPLHSFSSLCYLFPPLFLFVAPLSSLSTRLPFSSCILISLSSLSPPVYFSSLLSLLPSSRCSRPFSLFLGLGARCRSPRLLRRTQRALFSVDCMRLPGRGESLALRLALRRRRSL